jgi:hypothetical protein
MEGKDKLSESDLDTLVNKFKNKKDKYMMLITGFLQALFLGIAT